MRWHVNEDGYATVGAKTYSITYGCCFARDGGVQLYRMPRGEWFYVYGTVAPITEWAVEPITPQQAIDWACEHLGATHEHVTITAKRDLQKEGRNAVR